MVVTKFTVGSLAACSVLLAYLGLCFPTHFMAVKMWQTVGVMLLTSHALYPAIWYAPQRWLSIWADETGKLAVAAFSVSVALHKMLLGAVVGLQWVPASFYDNFASREAVLAYLTQPQNVFASAFLCGAVRLQQQVYAKIGADGVYYGFKLHRSVPWCAEYPFDFWRHPQYLSASIIFVAGMILLQIPSPSWVILSAWQLWSYACTSFMEESDDNNEPIAAEKTKKTL